VYATAPILGRAREWVTTNCEARGGTDILAPLQAVSCLHRHSLITINNSYPFLLSSGCLS
jgi:hypothetical protein